MINQMVEVSAYCGGSCYLTAFDLGNGTYPDISTFRGIRCMQGTGILVMGTSISEGGICAIIRFPEYRCEWSEYGQLLGLRC